MGTKEPETLALQGDIKRLGDILGWSQGELARHIYAEMHVVHDEDEALRFAASFKKELQRSSTKPDRLKAYLEIICKHRRLKALECRPSRAVALGQMSASLREEMRQISCELDEVLESDLAGRGKSL